MVQTAGVEPARASSSAAKSLASTSFATSGLAPGCAGLRASRMWGPWFLVAVLAKVNTWEHTHGVDPSVPLSVQKLGS